MFARLNCLLFDKYVSFDREKDEPACFWSIPFDENRRPTCPLKLAQREEKERAVIRSYSLTDKASE